MRHFLGLILVLLAGCPGSSSLDGGTADVPAIDAPAIDAPAVDAPAIDVPAIDVPAIDAPAADAPATDASTADASVLDAPADGGGLSCGVTPIDDFEAGVCDGRGMMGCTRWAEDNGGPGAVARCVPPEGRCARADVCGAAGCTCGGGPECDDDQMCIARPGGGFGCACLAGSGCTSTPIPDHVSGVCDGMGRTGCTMWAQELGGSSAVAQCVPPDGRCARADACSDRGCTCGDGPECADNEMCVSGIAGFSCVCLP